MNIPKLLKKPITKSCHGISWKDDYAWIHQDNILEVLKDSDKLFPEVKKFLEEENLGVNFARLKSAQHTPHRGRGRG